MNGGYFLGLFSKLKIYLGGENQIYFLIRFDIERVLKNKISKFILLKIMLRFFKCVNPLSIKLKPR